MGDDPLRALQEQNGAEFFTFGPAAGDAAAGFELVHTFGAYEAEYAAVRKGVGILHEPHRGILRLTGGDVKDFLHRLLTQDINGMTGGMSRRAFQLNDKGRITADLVVHHGDLDTWLEGDRFDLPELARLFDSRLFTEDVKVEDVSEQYVALSLHGPQAGLLLQAVADPGSDPSRVLSMPETHHVLHLAGAPVTCARRDVCGTLGVRLWCRREHAETLYRALADQCGGLAPEVSGGVKRPIAGRGIGWLAFNTARIEAGSPLFHIDFGTDSLPHETGQDLLSQTVSFTKGCYLGQEIVARMQNLGHPKRVLVGLRFTDDRLPIAGAQVFEPGQPGAVIGAVTSSTLSPMLGNVAIALAVMKWGKHRDGVAIAAPAEGALVPGGVQALRFI